nr:secernin-2 [Anaerolineae bacterium]NIN98157.1 secernin-2 [Anaerolineae bacterium]NIQ81080.1 secernin-2 [Anaerolineae bacterium]
MASPDIADYAIEKGWWPIHKRNDFDFALAYIDLTRSLQSSQCRVARANQLLRAKKNGHVSPRWMMRILRDHYETTFLGGPYFNAALPDLIGICMHATPSGQNWGNTASSSVAIVPKRRDGLAQFWWTPLTPCTGVYVPFFVNGTRVPAVVSVAGRRGKTVTRPSRIKQDEYSQDSYWWLFRELADIVKRDEVGSAYNLRQPAVRRAFDRLEKRFAARIGKVSEQWVELRNAGHERAAAEVLDEFSH